MGETEGTKALATDDPYDFLSPDDAPIEPPALAEPIAPVALDPAAPIADIPALDLAATVAPAVIVPPKAPDGYLPLAAVLDEREKRQRIEKERDDYRVKYEATLKPAAATPDVASDPQGWMAAQEEIRAKDRMDQKMEMSGFTAAQQYGEDIVSAAKTWGAEQNASDPYFGPAFTAQKYPFQWLVAKHREAQAAAWVGGKTPEERAIEYVVSLGYVKAPDGAAPLTQQPAPTSVVASPSPKPAPPRSIVGATPAGGSSTPVTLSEAEVGDIWSK